MVRATRRGRRIRTNWTNSVSRTHEFELDDLADAATRDRLKWAFSDPERLRPGETRQSLTERVAASFASVAQALRDRGHEPQAVAHFVAPGAPEPASRRTATHHVSDIPQSTRFHSRDASDLACGGAGTRDASSARTLRRISNCCLNSCLNRSTATAVSSRFSVALCASAAVVGGKLIGSMSLERCPSTSETPTT